MDWTELPRWYIDKESTCQCRRCRKHRFYPWVRKIPWSRKWQLTQYSCLENSMVNRAWQVSYNPWGHKESNTTKQLSTQYGLNNSTVSLLNVLIVITRLWLHKRISFILGNIDWRACYLYLNFKWLKTHINGTSWVVQWLRIRPAMQGMGVWSLLEELRPHIPRGNYWVLTLQSKIPRAKTRHSRINECFFKNHSNIHSYLHTHTHTHTHTTCLS